MAQFLAGVLRLYVPGLTGFILFAFLLLLGLSQNKAWARRGVAIFALIGLAQLVQVNYGANPTVPESFITYQPQVVSSFHGLPGSYRIAPMLNLTHGPSPEEAIQGYVNFDSFPEVARLSAVGQGAFQQKLLLGMGSMVARMEGSLNLDMERSMPPFLYDLWIYVLKQAPDTAHVDCLLGRTNVKYVIRPTRRDSQDVRVVNKIFNGSSQPSYLYEDLCYVPRAYVAGSAIFTTSPLETLSRMASPDFDALQKVILAAEPGTAPDVQGSGPAGRVEITEHRPNTVTLKADLSRPGYVVLLDRYDSNWRASIDGREVPVLRANQIFRAVYAEPGQHVVVFSYRQNGLLVGILVTCVTIASLLWLYLRNPPFAPQRANRE